MAGRIAVVNRLDVGSRRIADLGIGVDGFGEGLGDELGAQIGIAEPLRQALDQGVFELRMAPKINPPRLGSWRAASSASRRMRSQTGSTGRIVGAVLRLRGIECLLFRSYRPCPALCGEARIG
jgi:hypothetical protein